MRHDRNLAGENEKLGLETQASVFSPSRLASKASGTALGTNYIPPLDLPTAMNANMGGGSPTAPAPMQPAAVQSKQGIKRRPNTDGAKMTGQ